MTEPTKTTAPPMRLATAIRYADTIHEWLAPFCDRLEIAGSIRRRRDLCSDVDVVCIPKYVTSRTLDFFGETRNVLHDHLIGYVRVERRAWWKAGERNPSGHNFILQLPKCQLDIFTATAATWGSVLLSRTGSKEHNIWLAERALVRGWHWDTQRGLRIYDEALVEIARGSHRLLLRPDEIRPVVAPPGGSATSEEGIYQALDLPWIQPENRELERLLNFPTTEPSIAKTL